MRAEVHDAAPGSTIVFNVGSYTTIGVSSILIGTILASNYITTGENITIEGIGLDCGGMFATNGVFTLVAGSTVGNHECRVEEQQSEGNNEVEDDAGVAYFYLVFDPNASNTDYENDVCCEEYSGFHGDNGV